MAQALVIPGGMFGPAAGLLMYVGDVAEWRGARVCRHSWSTERPDPSDPAIVDWIRAEVEPTLDALGDGPLLIGKSLGTDAAVLAAERSLPAIWLTPRLTLPWVSDALRRASAPFLLVGGTSDRVWDGALARRLTPHVFEVDNADHGMYVPGTLAESMVVLAEVVAAAERFLDDIDWPA